MRTRLKTMNEIAKGLTNSDGRKFIDTYVRGKIVTITNDRDSANWFFAINENGFYYSIPFRKSGGCKASHFGPTEYFLKTMKEIEVRKQAIEKQ